jgi:hypothetical protein
MNLITVANKRVNLIIQHLIVMDLKGATDVVMKQGFIITLMAVDHEQVAYQILQSELVLSA